MARLVITAVLVEGRSRSAVARDYGVSRRWVQRLVGRYLAEGDAAFEPRSRRPLSSPRRTAPELEDEIVALRKSLQEEGLDAGAATIAYHLARRHDDAPSVSTVWRVLSRRGFVVAQPHKRPRSSILRFVAEQPNERWQADITHVRIANRYEVEVFNQIDDHSRLLVGSDARGTFKAADVVACFSAAAARWGTPASYLTDNAALFTGAYRDGAGWRWNASSSPGACNCATHGPTTPRPAARSSASIRPSSAGSSASPERAPSPTSNASSTGSASTTTTPGPTGRWVAGPRRRPLQPDRRRVPPPDP
jgi:transposase